jgi:hypothetical protein
MINMNGEIDKTGVLEKQSVKFARRDSGKAYDVDKVLSCFACRLFALFKFWRTLLSYSKEFEYASSSQHDHFSWYRRLRKVPANSPSVVQRSLERQR